MAQHAHSITDAPGPGERKFHIVRQLRHDDAEFAAFVASLHLSPVWLKTLAAHFRAPTAESGRMVFETMQRLAERYAANEATAQINAERHAASEPSLFDADELLPGPHTTTHS